MAGHNLPSGRQQTMPVDYKDGELSNLILIGVFITSPVRLFFCIITITG